jgi:hypothetical protein
MDNVSVTEHDMICELWRCAVIRPYDEQFKMLTSRGYKNPQDCMDALENLKGFQKRVVELLEG